MRSERRDRRIALVGMTLLVVAFVAGQLGLPWVVGLSFVGVSATVVALLARRYRAIALPLGVAFGVRAAAAIFQVVTHRLPDSALDAVTFDSTAWAWATDMAHIGSHFTLEAYLYSWLLAFAYFLFGHAELMALSFNVLLGTLIVLNVSLVASALWDERAGRRAAWAAALWPSLILYSAILLREAVFVYPLSLGLYLLVRWFQTAKPSLLPSAAIAFGVAAWFHRGAAPTIGVLAALAALLAVGALRRRNVRRAAHHVGAGVATCVVAVLVLSPLVGLNPLGLAHSTSQAPPATTPSPSATTAPVATTAIPPSTPANSTNATPPPNTAPSPTPTTPPPEPTSQPTVTPTPSPTPATNASPAPATPVPDPGSHGQAVLGSSDLSGATLAARQTSANAARSAYLTWLPERNLFDAVWQAPLRSFYFLFSPMPWNVTALKDVVGLLDGLLYLAVVVLLWRGRHALARDPAALALLAIVVVLLIVFADNTFNAGTALRHRAKLAPLLLALVPVVPWPRRRHDRAATRVLHVVNAPESFLQNRLPIAVAARARGDDVQVAGPAGPAVATIEGKGFRYHVVPLDRKGTDPVRELRTFFALVKLYRALRPDVVHHFTVKPVLYGGIAARFARVPACAHTITGLGYVFTSRDAKARALRPLVSLGYSFAFDHPNGVVVFQNPDDEREMLSNGVAIASRATVVHGSGVDVDAFPRVPERDGAPLVVLPARMLRDKGIAEFVEAARTLRETGARFALVGDTDDGNPAAVPRAQLESWAKEGVVEWWGWRTDMPRVYQEATIVCLPSYREGVPKSLLEAAACGRALVATDAPGCRDVVIDGRTGWLVPPRDARALALALRDALRDPAERRRRASAARDRVETVFAAPRISAAYLALYDRLLSPRASAA